MVSDSALTGTSDGEGEPDLDIVSLSLDGSLDTVGVGLTRGVMSQVEEAGGGGFDVGLVLCLTGIGTSSNSPSSSFPFPSPFGVEEGLVLIFRAKV